MVEYKPIDGVYVIGVGHKARHGKDTIANYLVQNYGATKFGFAGALYDVARVVFGMKEKDGPLLQVLGTDVFRKRDEDIWVRTLYYKLLDQKPKLAVIPDTRFPNEAAMIKSMGGTLIKIARFNEDKTPFVSSDRSPDHPSETALDSCEDWDKVITAKHGEFDRIYAEVATLMADLKLLKRI